MIALGAGMIALGAIVCKILASRSATCAGR
ncbi:hypothetical protein A2U01_0113880, partial [Trifolium medium]|nr:hypothetical protein [Trifolium medium]